MGGAGSGRRPLLNERDMEELLELSAKILFSWLSNPKVSEERKIPVVATLIAKRIPQRTEDKYQGIHNEVKVYFVDHAPNLPDNKKQPTDETDFIKRQAGALLIESSQVPVIVGGIQIGQDNGSTHQVDYAALNHSQQQGTDRAADLPGA